MIESGFADRPVALVTGASSGFGAATALRLARDGYDLAVTATRRSNLSAIGAEIEAHGAKVFPFELDLSQPASVEALVPAVLSASGRLDLLVNNAAVALHKAALEVTAAEWNSSMQTNLAGPYFICQAVARHWIDHATPGCIVNIASTHGLVAWPKRSVYGIAKAGLLHMTRLLAIEWAPHHIRVNAIAPGAAETATRAAFLSDPAARAATLSRIPAGRLANANEVAAAASYLAHADSDYVTGQTIVIDGGLTVQ